MITVASATLLLLTLVTVLTIYVSFDVFPTERLAHPDSYWSYRPAVLLSENKLCDR